MSMNVKRNEDTANQAKLEAQHHKTESALTSLGTSFVSSLGSVAGAFKPADKPSDPTEKKPPPAPGDAASKALV